jgi:hypothetical protein
VRARREHGENIVISQCSHRALTVGSQCSHRVLTVFPLSSLRFSQCSQYVLAVFAPCPRRARILYSQWPHHVLTVFSSCRVVAVLSRSSYCVCSRNVMMVFPLVLAESSMCSCIYYVRTVFSSCSCCGLTVFLSLSRSAFATSFSRSVLVAFALCCRACSHARALCEHWFFTRVFSPRHRHIIAMFVPCPHRALIVRKR